MQVHGCIDMSAHELMKPGGKKTCVEAAMRSSAALPDHELRSECIVAYQNSIKVSSLLKSFSRA